MTGEQPWSVGTLYLVAKRQATARQAFVASCVALFSASWSYDIYLLLRDGYYPVTWLANAFASSAIYLSAGLFWNLDWKPGPGMFFAFTQAGWPVPSSVRFVNVLWPAVISWFW